jgi:uncharacterized protein YjbI with pentapeptide repeats
MNQSDEDFSHQDLRGADLGHSTFYRANFLHADLWNCGFRDSDLTGARNLSQAQLAATDLTNAKLPEALATFEALDSVKDLSEKSSRVFTTLLISIVFTLVTSLTIRDSRLLTNTGYIKLPVVNIEAPVVWFYFVTPVSLCALFIYFHISLQRLWEAMATLPAIFPNGRRLDEKTPGWLLNDIPRQHIPRLHAAAPAASRLQWMLCVILAYSIVPVTVLFLWTQCLRLQNWFLTGTYILVFGVTVASAAGFSRLMDMTFAGKTLDPLRLEQRCMRTAGKWKGLFAGAGVAACLATLSYQSFDWDGFASNPIVDSLHFFRIQTEANVDNEEVSTRPATWTGMPTNLNSEIALTRGARFVGAPMRRLHAHNAFFVKSAFYFVDLTGCWFYNCDLRSSRMDLVEGPHARFLKCNCSDRIDVRSYTPAETDVENYHAVIMEGCRLQSLEARASQMCAVHVNLCDLQDADFQTANVSGGVFTNSVLVGVNFEYGDLHYAEFRGIQAGVRKQERITFHSADCSHAKFSNSDLNGATFEGATLDGAVFTNVILSDVDFGRASMIGTDLSQASGLTAEQLKRAKKLSRAKVPEELRDALAPLLSP